MKSLTYTNIGYSTVLSLVCIAVLATACQSVKTHQQQQTTSNLSALHSNDYYLTLLSVPSQTNIYEFVICKVHGLTINEQSCIPALVQESGQYPLFHFKRSSEFLPDKLKSKVADFVVMAESSPHTKIISKSFYGSSIVTAGVTLISETQILKFASDENKILENMIKHGVKDIPVEQLRKDFQENLGSELLQELKAQYYINSSSNAFDQALQNPNRFITMVNSLQPGFIQNLKSYDIFQKNADPTAYAKFLSEVQSQEPHVALFARQKRNILAFMEQLKIIKSPHDTLQNLQKKTSKNKLLRKVFIAIAGLTAAAGGVMQLAGSGNYHVKSALDLHESQVQRLHTAQSRTFFIPHSSLTKTQIITEFSQLPILVENIKTLTSQSEEAYIPSIEPVLQALVYTFAQQSEDFNFDPINRYCFPEITAQGRTQANCKTLPGL